MKLRTVDELKDVKGKTILVRDDFNVQIVGGKIMDAFRITQSLPTIRRLVAGGARVAVISHLGRPNGVDPELSLRPIAAELSKLLGQPVLFVDDCLKKDFISGMGDGGVALLENLRFHSGEESDDMEFAKSLADKFDVYVNDAFAVSHRAHASVHAVANLIPSFAGELLSREIQNLSRLIQAPARPLVGIISSSKLKSKIGLIKFMSSLCDKLILGGAIGAAFGILSGKIKPGTNLGDNIKDDIESPEIKSVAVGIMEKWPDKIVLPVDKGVAREFSPTAARRDKIIDDIEPGDIIMDEGPASVAEYKKVIDGAKTVVWNGTVGLAEWHPVWSVGTFAIARHIAEKTRRGELESIVGGGDTVAAFEAAGVKDGVTYASTGGGAFIEFIEGRELPGITALCG
jgi:phosphoglycerate kinase